MIKLIRLITVRLVAKLLHTMNITWYSSRLTFVLVDKFEIDVFDIIVFFIISTFLIYSVWKEPVLEGKPKKGYYFIKYSFHAAILGYIIYEGVHTGNYPRMGTSLFFYLIIEIMIIILNYTKDKRNKHNKESPPNEDIEKPFKEKKSIEIIEEPIEQVN